MMDYSHSMRVSERNLAGSLVVLTMFSKVGGRGTDRQSEVFLMGFEEVGFVELNLEFVKF